LSSAIAYLVSQEGQLTFIGSGFLELGFIDYPSGFGNSVIFAEGPVIGNF